VIQQRQTETEQAPIAAIRTMNNSNPIVSHRNAAQIDDPTRSFCIQRLYRLIRLSALAPSGVFRAMAGNWQLLACTIPAAIAANVVSCRAKLPVGSVGNSCFIAILMVRYIRQLSIGSLLFFLGWK